MLSIKMEKEMLSINDIDEGGIGNGNAIDKDGNGNALPTNC